jgi:hypothetical protein
MRDLSCVLSGYCCTVAPCPYGEADQNGGCIYLAQPNDAGQRECQKYPEIVEAEKNASSPMMGSGCSSTLFNTMREAVLANKRRQS